MRQYLEFIADQRLVMLGLQKVYGAKNPFSFMDLQDVLNSPTSSNAVTENSGKRTSGVDKVTWKTPEKKIAAVHSLEHRGYKPLPLKRLCQNYFRN